MIILYFQTSHCIIFLLKMLKKSIKYVDIITKNQKIYKNQSIAITKSAAFPRRTHHCDQRRRDEEVVKRREKLLMTMDDLWQSVLCESRRSILSVIRVGFLSLFGCCAAITCSSCGYCVFRYCGANRGPIRCFFLFLFSDRHCYYIIMPAYTRW